VDFIDFQVWRSLTLIPGVLDLRFTTVMTTTTPAGRSRCRKGGLDRT
jgi:hypothetical protein